MKRLLIVLVLLALPALSAAADLATPTATVALATPAATASPDGSQNRNSQVSERGGIAYELPNVAEGGVQIGKTSDGASLLTFAKRGDCLFNLPAVTAGTATTGVPGVAKVSCTATGVAAGDTVLTEGLDVYDTGTLVYEALSVSRCKATATDTILCWLHYNGYATPGLDPGPLTIRYVVLR